MSYMKPTAEQIQPPVSALTPEQRAEVVAIIESVCRSARIMFQMPRGEKTSGAAGALGLASTEQPVTTCTPAAGPEEAGPHQGEDEAMRIARLNFAAPNLEADAARIRAYGDARVREATEQLEEDLRTERERHMLNFQELTSATSALQARIDGAGS
jgi:hypothetical protein